MIVKLSGPAAETFDCVTMVVAGCNVLIDKEDFERVRNYHWHIRRVRWQKYAIRKKITNGKEFCIPMHRQIMHTPRAMVVHHRNRCGLDNRKCNLENMTQQLHHILHQLGG